MTKTLKSTKRKPKESIQKSIQQIVAKAESRKKAGRDGFHADWQASLELLLLMVEDLLLSVWHKAPLEQWLNAYDESILERIPIMTIDGGLTNHEAFRVLRL